MVKWKKRCQFWYFFLLAFFSPLQTQREKKAESVKHAKRWWWWWFWMMQIDQAQAAKFQKKKKPKQIRISFLQCFISQQKKNTQTQRLLLNKSCRFWQFCRFLFNQTLILSFCCCCCCCRFYFHFHQKKKKNVCQKSQKKTHTVNEHWVNEKTNEQTLILKFRVERFSFWFSSIDKKPPYHWIPLYWYLWMNGWWWSSSSISSMICNGIDCRLFFFHFISG